MLQKIANTIRSLTMDAVEQAGSGHPGLPMGCAELGAYLFAEFLQYDPLHPKWRERDRLILSAGHGSLWLYTCLHLAGFPLSIEDLKQFRQFGSKTPSHPDLTKTVGIEATTGVDGQGVGFGVGQALALKISGISSKVIVLGGDGCLMEGVSSESCSLAGHLNLNNLIVIYDSNRTTLDGYADSNETKMAWIAALEYHGPTALILSRQPLPELNCYEPIENALRGAYIIKQEESDTVKYLLIATGSEVHLALEVADELGAATRVISMLSWELFEKQPRVYKQALLQGEIKVSIEAGSEQGWHKYIGSEGIAIALYEFGECGSIEDLKSHFGYTKKQILQKIRQHEEELCVSL